MPATAAIDNETLDHLLSVVNDGPNIGATPRFERVFCAHTPLRRWAATKSRGVSPPEFPHRRIEPFQRERIHAAAHDLAHQADRSGRFPLMLGNRIEPDA